MSDPRSLGAYLKDRRQRCDAAALGFGGRRRTPGLRREEVAQRANISPTWYTWLEQGRGGAPSASTLERVAQALMLTEVEREHLFLLGLGRPPEVRYQPSGVTPRLQRLLDAFVLAPAMIRTATWDVVAWNKAAALVLADYGAPGVERNILRRVFLDPATRAAQVDWESVARFVVSVFRADAARAGASERVEPMVRELSALSPDFARMWRSNEVSGFGEGVKRLRHPILGDLALEYSTFAVDGRPDLGMIVYNPATDADAKLIRGHILAREERAALAA